MEVNKIAIDEVLREAEVDEPSPIDTAEERGTAPSRSRPKASVRPRMRQSSSEDTTEDIRGSLPAVHEFKLAVRALAVQPHQSFGQPLLGLLLAHTFLSADREEFPRREGLSS